MIPPTPKELAEQMVTLDDRAGVTVSVLGVPVCHPDGHTPSSALARELRRAFARFIEDQRHAETR